MARKTLDPKPSKHKRFHVVLQSFMGFGGFELKLHGFSVWTVGFRVVPLRHKALPPRIRSVSQELRYRRHPLQACGSRVACSGSGLVEPKVKAGLATDSAPGALPARTITGASFRASLRVGP